MRKRHISRKLATTAVLLWLAAPATAQFLPPSIPISTGGMSPRANQMKSDARDAASGSSSQPASSAKPVPATQSSKPGASTNALPTSPVHRAASEGKTDELRAYLAAHPDDIKKKDGDGYTALHHAALKDHLDSVQLLITSGANVNAQGARGETPLYLASAEDAEDVVTLLISSGADPNLATTDKRTPLQRAAMEGHLATVKALLKGGADASTRDSQGRTALDLAERYRVGPDANQVIGELLKAKK